MRRRNPPHGQPQCQRGGYGGVVGVLIYVNFHATLHECLSVSNISELSSRRFSESLLAVMCGARAEKGPLGAATGPQRYCNFSSAMCGPFVSTIQTGGQWGSGVGGCRAGRGSRTLTLRLELTASVVARRRCETPLDQCTLSHSQ